MVDKQQQQNRWLWFKTEKVLIVVYVTPMVCMLKKIIFRLVEITRSTKQFSSYEDGLSHKKRDLPWSPNTFRCSHTQDIFIRMSFNNHAVAGHVLTYFSDGHVWTF